MRLEICVTPAKPEPPLASSPHCMIILFVVNTAKAAFVVYTSRTAPATPIIPAVSAEPSKLDVPQTASTVVALLIARNAPEVE